MSVKSSIPVILFVSLSSAACVGTPDLAEDELELAPTYKANVKSRTLSIVGTSADSSLTLRLGATTTTLEVDVGGDGTAEFRFDRSSFERIRIDASGGNDVVTMDESAGAFTQEEQVTLIGGAGNDTLMGGVGQDTILGGTGNDTIHGRYSSDNISLGAGDDLVVWDPGGSSDVIEGDGGTDTLALHGSGIAEVFDLAANGDRLRLTRDIATVTMDLHGLEVIALSPLGGADRIVVNDLTDALVARVDVDLSAFGQPDTQPDVVVVNGTAGADVVEVARDGAAIVATGGSTEIRLGNGEPAYDRLVVNGDASDAVNINGSADADDMMIVADNGAATYDGGGFHTLVSPSAAATTTVRGLGGDDTIRAVGIAAPLALDGGDGNDTILGGASGDLLIGGAGSDTVDGSFGIDTVLLGDGDDLVSWNPGGASDVIEGEAGTDTFVFTGANIGESIGLSANGGRIALSRSVATVTVDLDGIEHYDVRALGGADLIVVHPLTGTAATQVEVNLAGFDGAGDAQVDSVTIDGNPGLDLIDVQADGNAVIATGLGAPVRVVGGEPATDRMIVQGDRLNLNGTEGPDSMFVYADASGSVYDGGGWNVLVSPQIETTVRGLGGDDVIRAVSVSAPLVFDGGDGNDTLFGGAGADLLRGGPGEDLVAGSIGTDTVFLGDGDDVYLWEPGGASDVIEGDLGMDTLLFRASAANDGMEVRAEGSRGRLSRNIGTVELDFDAIERVQVEARGGADTLVVRDLTGTAIAQVDVDLSSFPGSGTGDAQLDTVAVLGTAGDDVIATSVYVGGVIVAGLSAGVRIVGSEPTDLLDIHRVGGTDTVTTAPDVASLITVSLY